MVLLELVMVAAGVRGILVFVPPANGTSVIPAESGIKPPVMFHESVPVPPTSILSILKSTITGVVVLTVTVTGTSFAVANGLSLPAVANILTSSRQSPGASSIELRSAIVLSNCTGSSPSASKINFQCWNAKFVGIMVRPLTEPNSIRTNPFSSPVPEGTDPGRKKLEHPARFSRIIIAVSIYNIFFIFCLLLPYLD
jgi:hypothetical protein